MELSVTNISIDILTAILYIIVIQRAFMAIYHNHLPLRNKIYIGLFLLTALLYIFQTLIQIPTGVSSSPAIWNVINGIQVFIAISLVTLLSKKE